MRIARILGIVAVTLAGAALLAAWLVPPMLDWDRYRSTIAAVASAGLGRPVRIDGPIRLSLLPQASLRAGAVSFADTGDGATATVTELRLRIALGPLIAGQIKPEELVLHQPQMHLPWPLAAYTPRGAPAGLHARVEDGTLTIGALAVTHIDGELAVDPATGTLSAGGVATAMGRPWRMTGRLGRAGADGSATAELSLDGQGQAVGTGAMLSGQIAADGTLAGRIAGRGPDLSLLLAAPALPWRAEGQVSAGSGLVVADDLELDIAGTPARGAVALRLLPQLRLDAALATSRLDLDAWLPRLLREGRPALPTGIDLQAEAATLSGGTLRRLRAGFEMTSDGVTLREADAVLPGDAALHASGMLAQGRFTGRARLAAPDLAAALAWLRPHAPALFGILPPGALRTAELEASVTAAAGMFELHGLRGRANGAPVSGELSMHGGVRPALAVNLQLTGPVLDPFMPELPTGLDGLAAQLTGLPGRIAGFDGSLTIKADRPVWRSAVLAQMAVEALVKDGTLDIRRFDLAGPEMSASLSGSMAPDGRIADGRLGVSLRHAEALDAALPAGWGFARSLFRGPATLAATIAGGASLLAVTATADVADARLQVNGRADLPGRRLQGGASLHHPGALRLLWALGLGEMAAWLGDGSLSAQAAVDWRADRLALTGLECSAGAMRAGGDLTLTGLAGGLPVLAGTVAADTLALPPLLPHSADPWPLGLLHAANATLTVRAAHVLAGLQPVMEDAAARVSLADGALRIEGLTARVAGGALSGRIGLTGQSPPRLSLAGTLTGAALDGEPAGTPVDLAAGIADVTVDVSGAGYSPAGVLATLTGPVRVTVRDGALSGLDAGRVLSALNAPEAPDRAAAVADALQAGGTPFTRMDLAGTLASGALTLASGSIVAPAGTIAVSGSVDLPGEAIDLRLALRPALDGAPGLGLRLIGPLSAPSRTPELAELARWLAAR